MKTFTKLLSGAVLALVLSSCGSVEPYPGLVARPLPMPPPRIGPDYTRLTDAPGLAGIDRSIFTPAPRPTPDYTRVITPSSAIGGTFTGPTIPPFPRFPRL